MFLDVKLGSVNRFIVFTYSLFLIYIYSCDFAYQANSKRQTLGVICVSFETGFLNSLFSTCVASVPFSGREGKFVFLNRRDNCKILHSLKTNLLPIKLINELKLNMVPISSVTDAFTI